MVDPDIQPEAQLNQEVNTDEQYQLKNSPSQISDLPPEITEFYSTGDNIGDRQPSDRIRKHRHSRSPEITGGDVDADRTPEAGVGDETPGGTAPTPDRDIVDEIGAAVGLEMDDRAFLRTNEILEQRDDNRWELDPMSSDDDQKRRE